MFFSQVRVNARARVARKDGTAKVARMQKGSYPGGTKARPVYGFSSNQVMYWDLLGDSSLFKVKFAQLRISAYLRIFAYSGAVLPAGLPKFVSQPVCARFRSHCFLTTRRFRKIVTERCRILIQKFPTALHCRKAKT